MKTEKIKKEGKKRKKVLDKCGEKEYNKRKTVIQTEKRSEKYENTRQTV